MRKVRRHTRVWDGVELSFCVGGNPDEIKRSQRARFQPEEVVDEIIQLDQVAKKGKHRSALQ